MISDLSPGDRLSLKGKLFELQKKLNIIDLERKIDEQFSFQPKILEYDLPNRKKDFIENANKADIMRRQKKQMLEQSLALQSEESCTFAPKIYKSRHAMNLDHRPVHVRLNEKAKVYKDSLENRKVQFSTYDEDGNRLFVPKINPNKPAYLSPKSGNPEESVSSQPTSNIGADEFLYQDAKDREIRHQSRILTYEQEISKETNVPKMNPTSEKMLRKKMEKYATEIFSAMDENHDNEIDYNDIVTFIESCQISKTTEEQAKLNQLFWSIIYQQQQSEKVLKRDFVVICTAFLLHKTLHGISQLIRKYEPKKTTTDDIASNQEVRTSQYYSIAPHINHLKEKDIIGFRDILAALIQKLHEGEKFDHSFLQSSFFGGASSSQQGNETLEEEDDDSLFKPKISSYSYKLAEKKEKRDFQLLTELMPTLKYGQQVDNAKSSVSVDMSQLTLEDLDTSHIADKNTTIPANLQGIDPEIPVDVDLQSSPLSSSKSHSQTNKSNSIASIGGFTLSGNSFSSKQERLVAQALLIQKKREKLVEDVRKEQLATCTFHPKRETKKYYGKKSMKADSTVDTKDQQSFSQNDGIILESENPKEDFVEGEVSRESIQDYEHEHPPGRTEAGDDNNESTDIFNHQPDQKEENERILEIDLTKEIPTAQSLPQQSVIENTEQGTTDPTSNKPSRNKGNKKNEEDSTEPSIYDRLYSLKDKKPKALTEIQPSYLQELQSCTFHPRIPKHHKNLDLIKSKVKAAQESKPIEGFSKAVDRIRKTIQEKEKKQQEESDENLRKIAEEKYAKSRELSKQGFQPFQFHLQDRIIKHKLHEEHYEHRPDLIVDVKLSANRSARIRVQHGDDPAELATRFSKIYSLDKDAMTILETVLKESMIQRGILPDPRKANRSPSILSARDRRNSYGSGSESGNGSRGHRKHRRRHRHSRRLSSRDGRDSFLMTGEEMAEIIENNVTEGSGVGEGGVGLLGRSMPYRPHRIDTENSEMLGDTSIVVVEDEYSSYTESANSSDESDSDASNYHDASSRSFRHDVEELDATANYLQKHGSLRSTDQNRRSILAELL